MSKNPKKPNIISPPSWGEGGGGVICSESGIVNWDATEELRNEIKETQAEQMPIFNKGPELDEILAKCKKETHLKAPKPPVFQPSTDVAVAAE